MSKRKIDKLIATVAEVLLSMFPGKTLLYLPADNDPAKERRRKKYDRMMQRRTQSPRQVKTKKSR